MTVVFSTLKKKNVKNGEEEKDYKIRRIKSDFYQVPDHADCDISVVTQGGLTYV